MTQGTRQRELFDRQSQLLMSGALAICLTYLVLYPAMRPFGAAPFLLVAGIAGVASIRFPFAWARLGLWLFAGFASLVLIASLAGAMPKSWTVQYEAAAAIRHWLWIPLLIIYVQLFFWGFRLYLRPLILWSHMLVLGAFALSRIARYVSAQDLPDEAIYGLYTLNNDTIFVFALAAFAMHRFEKVVLVRIGIPIILLALSTSAQSQIASIMFLLIAGAPRSIWISRAYLVAIVIFLLFAPGFIRELTELDKNMGIRGLFWKDTWVALYDTFGLGVGFGTEYITNDFRLTHQWSGWQIVEQTDEGRLFVGTHSAFYDVALRTGIIGTLLLLTWLGPLLWRKIWVADARYERLTSCIVILTVTSLSVNMGFASYNFVIGNAFCLALIAYFALLHPMSALRLSHYSSRQTPPAPKPVHARSAAP